MGRGLLSWIEGGEVFSVHSDGVGFTARIVVLVCR